MPTPGKNSPLGSHHNPCMQRKITCLPQEAIFSKCIFFIATVFLVNHVYNQLSCGILINIFLMQAAEGEQKINYD